RRSGGRSLVRLPHWPEDSLFLGSGPFEHSPIAFQLLQRQVRRCGSQQALMPFGCMPPDDFVEWPALVGGNAGFFADVALLSRERGDEGAGLGLGERRTSCLGYNAQVLQVAPRLPRLLVVLPL